MLCGGLRALGPAFFACSTLQASWAELTAPGNSAAHHSIVRRSATVNLSSCANTVNSCALVLAVRTQKCAPVQTGPALGKLVTDIAKTGMMDA